MEVTKLQLNGNEYNFTDADAQSKISEIKSSTYTKEFVDLALSDIDESLKDYAKSADVAANYQPKGNYLTEHQSLKNYYTKTEVDKAIDAIPQYDDTTLSNRVTFLEAIDHSQYLTEHLDISGLATKAEVKTVSDKVNAIKVPTKVSELTNDSKYQTESLVNSAIEKVVGAAPEALDTLEEIAEKLNDNDDVVAGLVSTVSTKADKSEVDTALDNISKSYIQKGTDATKILLATGGTTNLYKASAISTCTSDDGVITPLGVKNWTEGKFQPKGNYLTSHQSLANYPTKKEVSDSIVESNEPVYINEISFLEIWSEDNKIDDSYTLSLSPVVFNAIYEKLRNAYIGNRPVYIKFYDELELKYRLHFTMFDDTMAYLIINYGDIVGIHFNPEDNTVNLLNSVLEKIENKVDRVSGKGLSTNDYTNADKTTVANLRKLNSISHIKDGQTFTATATEVKINYDCVSASAGDGNYTPHSEKIPVASSTSAGVITAADKVKLDAAPTIWTGTEAQYNALTTKDNNTLYLIPE